MQQGQAQLDAGKLAEAIATFEQLVEQDPASSLAFTRLGGAQVLQQEYLAGIESFRRAIMLDQGNADAFVGMAVAYLHTGQYALAREALREAERIDPSKKPEIDKVLGWLGEKTSNSTQ